MLNAEQVFQAIQSLPGPERRRLVDRIVHELADVPASEGGPPRSEGAGSLLGLFADEPELVDEVCAMAFEARNTDRLRSS